MTTARFESGRRETYNSVFMSSTPDLYPRHAAAIPERAFRRTLLLWYDKNRRDLPWRKTREPYRIWISEIMLQQTRVAAVLEHYRLFLQRFPTINTLATASEDEVLTAWSGLGYYRRARLMRHCAIEIVEDHQGHFPSSSQALQSLPGIGRYTAAAIASIAFAEPTAVVDGNVERVLERLAGRKLDKKSSWQQAQTLLDSSRPADFNQAMMELGALVCTPRQPKCGSCPVKKKCATQGEAPRTASPQRQSKKEIWYTLDEQNHQIRLVQRSSRTPLMAGMWELPIAPQSRAAKRPRKAREAWRTFRHSITVTNYTVHVIRGSVPTNEGKWIPIGRLSAFPLTGLARKILRAAGLI
jgi:A/G-specific adenine glycosylase